MTILNIFYVEVRSSHKTYQIKVQGLGNLWETTKILCWLFVMVNKILGHSVLNFLNKEKWEENFQLKPCLIKRNKCSAVRIIGPWEIYGWIAITAHICSAPDQGSCAWTTSCGVMLGVPELWAHFILCNLLVCFFSFVYGLSVKLCHLVMIAFVLFLVSGKPGFFFINNMHCSPTLP